MPIRTERALDLRAKAEDEPFHLRGKWRQVRQRSEVLCSTVFALIDWLRNGNVIFFIIAVSLVVVINILPGLAVERANVQRMSSINIDRLPIAARWLNESVGGEGGLEGFLGWGSCYGSLVRRLLFASRTAISCSALSFMRCRNLLA